MVMGAWWSEYDDPYAHAYNWIDPFAYQLRCLLTTCVYTGQTCDQGQWFGPAPPQCEDAPPDARIVMGLQGEVRPMLQVCRDMMLGMCLAPMASC